MYLETEIITLASPIYYSYKEVSPYHDIEVYLYDKLNEKYLNKLERVNSFHNSLLPNQFSVDLDKGLFYFSTLNTIGNTYAIRYYTNGDINPFNISSDLFRMAMRMVSWTNNRLIDGFYLYRKDSDERWIWTVRPGSFVLNSMYYSYKGESLNFKYIAPPTLMNLYRCYILLVNNTVLENSLDRQHKMLYNLGICYSTALHESMIEAKNDAIERYKVIYGSEPRLTVAHVYLSLDESNYNFWIEYPEDNRLV